MWHYDQQRCYQLVPNWWPLYLKRNLLISYSTSTHPLICQLTHYGLVIPYVDIDLSQQSLDLIMVCCLMAPSHYKKQCWLIISGVLWNAPEGNFTGMLLLKISILNISLKIIILNLEPHLSGVNELTHWGWVMHICIGNLTIIGSANGLLPVRHQAIIWNNAGILLIGP